MLVDFLLLPDDQILAFFALAFGVALGFGLYVMGIVWGIYALTKRAFLVRNLNQTTANKD